MNPTAASPTAGSAHAAFAALLRHWSDVAPQSHLAPEEFYAALLQSSLDPLSATGGAAWRIADADKIESSGAASSAPASPLLAGLPELLVAVSATGPTTSGEQLARVLQTTAWHQEFLCRSAATGTPLATTAADESPQLPSTEQANWFCVAAPVMIEQQAVALVELVWPLGQLPASPQVCTEWVAALAEVAVDYQHRWLWHRAQQQDAWRQAEAQCFLQLHYSLDRTATAYTLANEGRRLVGCDRLSVLCWRRGRLRLEAVSGIDVFDPRAEAVVRLERLAAVVVATRDSLWHDDIATPAAESSAAATPLAPQVAEPLDAYLDAVHVRRLGIVLLRVRTRVPADASPRSAGAPRTASRGEAAAVDQANVATDRIVGALVIEQFAAPAETVSPGASPPALPEPPPETMPWQLPQRRWPRPAQLDMLAEQGALALHNAERFESLPLARLWRLLGRDGFRDNRARRRWPLVAAALLWMAGLLSLVPADFTIEARGRLQPSERREIFAPADAVVRRLHVSHASQVTEGDLLAELFSPQLDAEQTRLLGERQTVEQRLAGIEAARLTLASRSDATSEQRAKLTAELDELRLRLTSLQRQLDLLAAQRKELELRAPFSGSVLTWDVQPLLAARPVARGESLLSIARLDGPWQLDLDIPDKRLGPVLAFRQAQAGEDAAPQRVEFVLATNPQSHHEATLRRVALRAESGSGQRAMVRGVADFDAEQLARLDLRPGAEVVAKIECGRRPIGYVWGYGLVQALRTWLWW